MRNQSRRLLRAGSVAGLLFTALPFAHTPWSPLQHAAASRIEVRGFSPSLLVQAAKTPQRMIFVLRAGQPGGTSVLINTLRQTGAQNVQSLDLINGVAAQVSATTLTALRYNSALLEMAVDHQHQPLPTPDYSPLDDQIAHASLQKVAAVAAAQPVLQEPDTLNIIHADTVHKQYEGQGVRIAIVDSGIDYGHPDLAGIMLKGANGKPLYADFTGTDLTDTVGHGTAVAGVIAAQSRTVYSVSNTYRTSVYPLANPAQRFNDVTYFKVGGVAPAARIMAAKIFDHRLPGDGGYDSTIVRAIEWAIANHADIISESFGQTAVVQTNPSTDIVAMADEEAVRHGITVVAADGNSGPGASSVSSPAQAPDVIAAGASTDYQAFAQSGFLANYNATSPDSLASFTSRGPTYDGRIRPDLYAPGAFGWSTVPRNPSEEQPTTPPYLLELFGGTSMATPVLAGSAALVINAYEKTHAGKRPSPAYVKQVLTSTADNMGYPAGDQAAGRVNVQRAVNLVTRQGSSILLSGALSLQGKPGDQPAQTIAVTNTGTTAERLTFAPQQASAAKVVNFKGNTIADNLSTFRFTVPVGVTKLTAAAYWNEQLTIPQPNQGTAQPLAMVIRLYDPKGNFVNYTYSGNGGAGNVKTTAGLPVPGIWTAVISSRTRRDNNDVAHYVNVPFTGQITMDHFTAAAGTVSPRTLTLQPGQHARVSYLAARLSGAGTQVITLHVNEHSLDATSSSTDTLATVPVVITTAVAIAQGRGAFTGAFTGADDASFDEVNYYTFTVPTDTKSVALALTWPHVGYWFALALLDPQGRAYNLVDNALVSGSSASSGPIDLAGSSSGGKIDLSQKEIDAYVNAPTPGKWRVEIINLQFAGTQTREQYTGKIILSRTLAKLNTSSVTAQAGGDSVPFTIKVSNPYGGIQGYFTYATTDKYTYLPLGGSGGILQNAPLAIGSTQSMTYSTNFVPPGTREIISQAEALNSKLPVAVAIDDPVLLTFAKYGQPATQSLGGMLGQGYAAVVSGPSLPIGRWQATVSLPTSKTGVPVSVAANTIGYSLAPNPWVTTDAQLHQNGQINATGFPVALARTSVTLHGSVRVPNSVAPGSYTAHIFVYSFREDQLADLPLTIKVTHSLPAPAPTPDPYLAAMVSNQYFPEGATGPGLLTQMDMVNPGTQDAHAQIKVLTATGWTTVMRYNLKPRSRTSVDLDQLVGDNQAITAEVQGDEPIISGRRIARTGNAGSYSVGTMAPSTQWYFADGYTIAPFQEYLTIVNPSDHVAHVHVHAVSDQGDTRDGSLAIAPSSRGVVRVSDLLSNKAVSATVSSDVAVVAERTEVFGSNNQGITTAVGATTGVTSAYLDPGHLPAGTQGHISLYNPHSQTAHVVLTLLDKGGAPVHNLTVTLKPGARSTVDLSAKYGTVSLGAKITSDVEVVVEKVAYFGNFKKSHIGGSDVLASATPAAHLIFPDGTTQGGAVEYLSLYNPGTTSSKAVITVFYDGNKTAHHAVTVPAGKRIGVSINALALPAGPSSLLVDTTDGSQLFGTQTLLNAGATDGSELAGALVAGS